MCGTCREDNCLSFKCIAVFREYRESFGCLLHTGNIFHRDFSALAHSLFEELVAELIAADGLKARDVLDLRGIDDLSAEYRLLDHQYCLKISSSVNSGGETRRSPADYDDIVHSLILLQKRCL